MSMIEPVTSEVSGAKPAYKVVVRDVKRLRRPLRATGFMALGVATLPLTIIPIVVIAIMVLRAIREDLKLASAILESKEVAV